MSVHRLTTVLGALLALAPLSTPCAQNPPTEPRNAPDPRPSTDPRDASDPRDVKDPRDAKDPRVVKDPYETLEGKELYEALYKADEIGRLKTALHDDAWQVLPYIDSFCEGWLALIEHGANDTEDGKKALADMQAKGRKLADMADSAIGDTRFSNYVNNFYNWTPEQQKTFREGQSLYHDGEKLISTAATPEEAMRAMTPLQQSLDRARALGDTWGQSMTLAMMGYVQGANRMETEARNTMSEAQRIGREIRDLKSVWDALSLQYESAVRTNEYEPARDALTSQYLIAKDVNNDETADQVMKQLVELNAVYGKSDAPLPGPPAAPVSPPPGQ